MNYWKEYIIHLKFMIILFVKTDISLVSYISYINIWLYSFLFNIKIFENELWKIWITFLRILIFIECYYIFLFLTILKYLLAEISWLHIFF